MKNNVFEKIGFSCIGCGLCEAICPEKCISLKEVSNKGIIPYVDSKKCTNCGLCINFCPVPLIDKNEEINGIKGVFIGRSKDDKIIENSTSGGIISSILIDLFQKKEIDVAVVAFVDDELNIYGDFITSEEVLNHSGSFYHTSKMLVNIGRIKQYKSVVFVGLPCQNAALTIFEKKFNTRNIYAKISLTCTIGRMRNGMIDYLKENNFYSKGKLNVLKYKSRHGLKRPGDIIIETNERNIRFSCEDYLLSKDYYYIPEGCLKCRKLFGLEFADISVGDNWGIRDDEKIAIFTANSRRGLEILNNNLLIDMSNSTIEELKKSQPLGYPLKYTDRTMVNQEIKILKYLYRVLPQSLLFRKLLYKLRSIILVQLSRRKR